MSDEIDNTIDNTIELSIKAMELYEALGLCIWCDELSDQLLCEQCLRYFEAILDEEQS